MTNGDKNTKGHIPLEGFSVLAKLPLVEANFIRVNKSKRTIIKFFLALP